MIFSSLFARVESQARTQTGSPNHINLAPPATSGGVGCRLTLLAAALFGAAVAGQAQLLSLNIDTVAKTYTWTGSASFQIETGTADDMRLGIGYNFRDISDWGRAWGKHFPGGLNAVGQNLRPVGGEPEVFTGKALLASQFQSLYVGSHSVSHLLGALQSDQDSSDHSYLSASYDVAVQGDGIAYSLEFIEGTTLDVAQLHGKPLQFFFYDHTLGIDMATGFLDVGTISVTPVPEPASVALASAVGLVGFAVWRRRNQAKRALSQDAAF